MAINIKRFFATLHFAQNDNYLDNSGKGVGGSKAASNPLPISHSGPVVIQSVAMNL